MQKAQVIGHSTKKTDADVYAIPYSELNARISDSNIDFDGCRKITLSPGRPKELEVTIGDSAEFRDTVAEIIGFFGTEKLDDLETSDNFINSFRSHDLRF